MMYGMCYTVGMTKVDPAVSEHMRKLVLRRNKLRGRKWLKATAKKASLVAAQRRRKAA